MTRYTLDHAAGNRILAESTPTGTVLYLYSGGGTGTDVCLGEIRAGVPRYYLPDAAGYVRQSVDTDGAVASSWLFDPDGTVLEGPDGPVSHLVCGGVYDWSTGLLYQGGSYFDPRLGIWLALLPLVVLQAWPGRKRRKGQPWGLLILLMTVEINSLTFCNPSDPIKSHLNDLCIDSLPKPGSYQLSVELHNAQEGTTRPGSFNSWQVRLGEENPTTPEEAGAYIEGKITPLSNSNNNDIGKIELIQYVTFEQQYSFESNVPGSPPQIWGGLDKKWYIDSQEPHITYYSPGYTGNKTCEYNDSLVNIIFDSPGSNIKLVEKTGNHMLLTGFRREEKFRTYLIWNIGGIQIPLAGVKWSWETQVEAIRQQFPDDRYPLIWHEVDFSTDPQVGEKRLGTPLWDFHTNSPILANDLDIPITNEWAPKLDPYTIEWEFSGNYDTP